MKEQLTEGTILAPHTVIREFDFYGDKLAIVLESDQIYIALRPVADLLGLDWSAQYRRVLRDHVLSKHIKPIRVMSHDGKRYQMLCLQLEYFHGWLFSIIPSRIKPELTQKLDIYREECFRVLWNAFDTHRFSDEQPNEENTLDTADSYLETNFYPLTHQQIDNAVKVQCRRATKAGLPATLTASQWVFSLKTFKGNCAYCQARPGIIIEHFIPLELGGSTTIGNCVPSCYSCNAKKGNNHPDEITTISRETLDTVRRKLEYLEGVFPF